MEDKNIRKGICKNYGDCDKASNKEIIEVREGEAFECPECHEPLTQVDDKGKPIAIDKPRKRKSKVSPFVYIVGAVLVILLIIVIIFIVKPLSTGGNESNGGEGVGVDTGKVDTTAIVTTDIDTIALDTPITEPVPPEQGKEKDSLQKKVSQTSPQPQPTPPTTPSVHKLSYGTWKGGWKNGKPHGQGTLTYSVETVIDSRDSRGRVAQPGEYIIGEWDEGHLVNGRWFKNDKNSESIIIGKAG